MENIEIKLIETKNILTIVSLLQQLHKFTPKKNLEKRGLEMIKQHYKYVGMYLNEAFIGISGLWFLTKHTCGRTIAPAHVIINEAYRKLGLGKKLFDWIHTYAQSIGYEATELNTFIKHEPSQRFYENEGYKKLGYHYLKIF